VEFPFSSKHSFSSVGGSKWSAAVDGPMNWMVGLEPVQELSPVRARTKAESFPTPPSFHPSGQNLLVNLSLLPARLVHDTRCAFRGSPDNSRREVLFGSKYREA
jgi:hypothetical protein